MIGMEVGKAAELGQTSTASKLAGLKLELNQD